MLLTRWTIALAHVGWLRQGGRAGAGRCGLLAAAVQQVVDCRLYGLSHCASLPISRACWPADVAACNYLLDFRMRWLFVQAHLLTGLAALQMWLHQPLLRTVTCVHCLFVQAHVLLLWLAGAKALCAGCCFCVLVIQTRYDGRYQADGLTVLHYVPACLVSMAIWCLRLSVRPGQSSMRTRREGLKRLVDLGLACSQKGGEVCSGVA